MEKTEFTVEEVKRAKSVCAWCQYCGFFSFCSRYKTDSIVFKYDKCSRLRKGMKE